MAAKTTRKAIVTRLAQLRAQRAKLLGYPNHATFALDDQMAKTPQNAEQALDRTLCPPATAKARDEAARMQKLIDSEKGGFKLGPQDWQYYAEKVRKAEYDLDESQIKPYFELDHVLHDGVFFAANKLYGITFKERKDLPVYNPDVRVFEVFDADGKSLALFYADYFSAREQERRRLEGQLRRSEQVSSARSRSSINVAQLHEAGAGPAGAAQLRRRDDDVP